MNFLKRLGPPCQKFLAQRFSWSIVDYDGNITGTGSLVIGKTQGSSSGRTKAYAKDNIGYIVYKMSAYYVADVFYLLQLDSSGISVKYNNISVDPDVWMNTGNSVDFLPMLDNEILLQLEWWTAEEEY